jgi:tetratricopeptide (TPR) repeat protein
VREILYSASQIEASERAQYLKERCGADGSLHAEVEDLLRSLQESGSFLEASPSLFAGLEEAQIGPYRIVDEAGRGGMGVVYRALRDGDYRQMVAIKLVRSELATKPLTDRFRVERQTLALLNHPNIARLMDGGATADGRPYLVMEWIDGCPIHQYARDHALTTRPRLELFLRVCEAVAYAHRNLVVHRDLKPSNILITVEGQPKLLDFGIAKVFHAEEPVPQATLTMTGVEALTPEYASPEQVRQEPVTTATDIYSLGAVLYELLTGTQAHHIESRTPAAIERAVCGDPPPPASSVATTDGVPRRELRGDLDNILAKALEKDPARRYRNVDEFAADLRRHLDCQPVLARPATLAYRASRFTRRNKLLVTSVAAVVLALAGGLGVALWEARRARMEQELAEQRFQLARQLAGSVLHEFHDGIRDLQGSLEMRQLLLTRSLEYLDKLAAGAGANPPLQRDLANGYERVAELAGGAGRSNLGRDQEALASLRKALELRKLVLAADPHSVEFRRELARTHREFVSLGGVGAAESLEHAAASASLVEGLLLEAPGDSRIQADLAVSEYDMGSSLAMQARYPEAAGYFRKALAHATDSSPGNLALYHKRLGAVLISTGALPGALAEYRVALAGDEPRAAANPADGRAQLDLSYDYSDIGLIFRRMGRLPEGLEQFRKAYRIREQVAASEPKNERAAHALASIAWRIAAARVDLGERRGGESAYAHAVALAEQYRSHFPEKQAGGTLLADIEANFGDVYQRKWGSCSKARPLLQHASELYRSLNNTEAVRSTEKLMNDCATK